jgi:hypothetical protein
MHDICRRGTTHDIDTNIDMPDLAKVIVRHPGNKRFRIPVARTLILLRALRGLVARIGQNTLPVSPRIGVHSKHL